jgi:hypothetical protein
MKTLSVVLIVAAFLMVPFMAIYGVDAPKGAPPAGEPPKAIEKPMSIEDLLTACEAGNKPEAFDMFLKHFTPMIGRLDKVFITYRGYDLATALKLECKPLLNPDLVVVPLGPAIMAQLGIKGGVLVEDVKGDMLKAGLQKYDVITSVAGTECPGFGAFEKLCNDNATKEGKEVEFGVIRATKPMTVKVKLFSPPYGPRVK